METGSTPSPKSPWYSRLYKRIGYLYQERRWVVLLFIFVSITIVPSFLGRYNLLNSCLYRREISSLRREIRKLQVRHSRDSLMLDSLNELSVLERVGRMRYNFQKPNEITFLIVDTTSNPH